MMLSDMKNLYRISYRILDILRSKCVCVCLSDFGAGVRTNGFPWHPSLCKQLFYDTFPLIFLDKGWAYRRRSLRTPRQRADDEQDPEHIYQRDLFEIFRNSTHWSENRVYSCFGGAALYPADAWLTPECHYSSRSSRKTKTERLKDPLSSYRQPHTPHDVCEHVRFHYCLHSNHANLSFAIDGDAVIERLYNV